MLKHAIKKCFRIYNENRTTAWELNFLFILISWSPIHYRSSLNLHLHFNYKQKLAQFYVTYFWTEKCSLQFQNKHDLWIDYLKLSFSPVAEVDPGYSCVSRAGL